MKFENGTPIILSKEYSFIRIKSSLTETGEYNLFGKTRQVWIKIVGYIFSRT